MLCELDEAFWDDLLNRVEEGEIIPVVGPGAVTFGYGDEILYPWLAGRLASELTPRLQFENPPSDLQAVVDAQRRAGQPIDRIYRRLYRMVEDRELRPGPTLAALAAIEPFKLMLTTTFDPLLIRDFVVWDDDVLYFLLGLDHKLPSFFTSMKPSETDTYLFSGSALPIGCCVSSFR